MPCRILFLHSTASFGGASKSLCELGNFFPNKKGLYVIAPRGSAVEFFRGSGFNVFNSNVAQFNHTEYGYYQGFRWLVLLRELYLLPFSVYKICSIVSSNEFDLVHLNEVTLLPWAWLFKKKGLPVVVHVRSVYKPFKNSIRDLFFLKLFIKYVDHVIAIDETVKSSLPEGLSVPVTVVHNGLNFSGGFPPPKVFDLSPDTELNVCIVGSLLRLKGLYEFIKASKIIADKGLKIKFHIAGTNPRKNGFISGIYKLLGLHDDVEGDLKRFVEENGLNDFVVFHGLVKDIKSFYSIMDVVCFPSYYNAPGRPVFEAAYYGIPAIVAVDRPTCDTIIHNETGLVIDRPSAELISEQIERLYYDRGLLSKLGNGARNLAEQYYSIEKNSSMVFKIYESIFEKRKS